MSTTNIFDMKNLDDLPDSVKEGISSNAYTEKIIKLFRMAKRPLTIDEVTVAYYRVYKEVRTRRQINSKLYGLTKAVRPLLERSAIGRRGFYSLREKRKSK